jgi:dehydrogenase/reductase SDR family protein 4
MIMPYSVSKTALLGLTKALSFELGPENIRVNCIAPGIIDTKFSGAVSFFKLGTYE